MLHPALITESLRTGSALDGLNLVVRKIARHGQGVPLSAGRPGAPGSGAGARPRGWRSRASARLDRLTGGQRPDPRLRATKIHSQLGRSGASCTSDSLYPADRSEPSISSRDRKRRVESEVSVAPSEPNT